MSNLVIVNTEIKQDGARRFSLNDLHKASGGNKKHQPRYWLANQATQELIEELRSDSGIPLSVKYDPINVVRGGIDQGTFVCKELVYSYAMWISPKFHLEVIRTFDRVVNQGVVGVGQFELSKSGAVLISLDGNNQVSVKPVASAVINAHSSHDVLAFVGRIPFELLPDVVRVCAMRIDQRCREVLCES